MKHYIKLVFAVLLLCPLSLMAADINGDWTATFETQVGTQNYTYTFVVNGAEVSGTIVSANGETSVEKGMLEGDVLTFTETLNYQGMELLITYVGEVSDTEISFTRDVAGLAQEEFTAVRPE